MQIKNSALYFTGKTKITSRRGNMFLILPGTYDRSGFFEFTYWVGAFVLSLAALIVLLFLIETVAEVIIK
jgi:hypothetical protein